MVIPMEGIRPQHGQTTTAGTPTTKAALSSQLFKDPECWSVQGSKTHDLLHGGPTFN